MSLRRTFTWLAIAPLGIGLTTGLTITTTLLTQQPIGLSSEPLAAGDALAPRATATTGDGIRAHAARTPSAPAPHGGRAVATAVSGTRPPGVAPPPAAPAPPPAAAPTSTTTAPPAPAAQPAHTPPPPQTQRRSDRHGGRDAQHSRGGGGDDTSSDNSGSGARDD